MAVDRESRDELAETIAALMRGDKLISDLRDIDWNHDENQKTDELLKSCHVDLYIFEKRSDDSLRFKKHEWGRFERWLVMLNTDIDWDSVNQPKLYREPEISSKIRLLLVILYIFSITNS